MLQMIYLTESPDTTPTPIWLVTKAGLKDWLGGRPAEETAWIEAAGFEGAPGSHLLLPSGDGGLAGVVAGVAEKPDLWALAGLPAALPGGAYQIADGLAADRAGAVALGWAMGTYRFDRYKTSEQTYATLVWPDGADRGRVEQSAAALRLVRDLVNT
ncbi:MAG: hypothetical protein MI806_26920, partial [Minwuiales bacterium]|nr:hypothetical protein [Minwuiales bacterium]